MGWAVLYIAFGGVALWLLGEVLLQYKARLRWRLLAFTGFLGVVVGVLMPSVIVIALGAIAFAVGQTYVTLSFRRGFAAGWAVKRPEGGAGGGSKRRRGRAERPGPVPPDAPADADATVGDHDPGHGGDHPPHGHGPAGGDYDDDYERDDVFTPAASRTAEPAADGTTGVYAPQPLPDDTGNYGVYGDTAYANNAPQPPGYDYADYGRPDYDYDTAGRQQGYANYSDPYIGSQPYASYDQGYGGQDQQYGQQPGYPQDPYATGGHAETPPGGVWVPQQRTDEVHGGELPQEQPYPHQPQPGVGYDEQYRF